VNARRLRRFARVLVRETYLLACFTFEACQVFVKQVTTFDEREER